MEFTLTRDKTTPGTIRFKEDATDHPLAIYLTKAQVAALEDPQTITVTVEKVS